MSILKSNFLLPHCLLNYSDGSILVMDYSNLGTIIDCISGLNSSDLSNIEHEVVVFYITKKFLTAINLLHDVDIIHCDIKPGM